MSTGYTIDDRLHNWARWYSKNRLGRGGNYAKPKVEERVDGDRTGWDASAIVRDDEADAIDIDQAVHRVGEEHRTVVMEHYVRNRLMREKLARANVSKTQYYARVRAAGRQVEEQVTQIKALRQARARAESERLKPVLESARPW